MLFEGFAVIGVKNGKEDVLYGSIGSYTEAIELLEKHPDTHNYYRIEKRYVK